MNTWTKYIMDTAIRSAVRLTVLALAVFLSVLSIVGTFTKWGEQEAGLTVQIEEVESAIGSLHNLERYLEKTKSDMLATQEAKDKIELEYSKAKELEKLTKKQIDAISLAVNRRTIRDALMDHFWGFVLGVAGSLAATYIYGMLRRRRQAHAA